MMLPTAHAKAAPTTSAKPTKVPESPLASLYAASTTHAGRCDDGAEHVVALHAVAGEGDGEADREEDLHLDHERRQPGRHAEPHSQEQQAELADADRDAVGDDAASTGIAGGRTKNTIGNAASRKRSAASVNGGTSARATLIGTNV